MANQYKITDGTLNTAVDPYTDWNENEGEDFDTISLIAKAVAKRKSGNTDPQTIFSYFVELLDIPLEEVEDSRFLLFSLLRSDNFDTLKNTISLASAGTSFPINSTNLSNENITAQEAPQNSTNYRLPIFSESIRDKNADGGVITNIFDDLDDDNIKVTNGMHITAIIDSTTNIANAKFRELSPTGKPTNKSRVDFAWIMDGIANPKGKVAFGREWLQSDITSEITSVNDEEEILRKLDIIKTDYRDFNSARNRVTHGTHIMDLACGYPDPRGSYDVSKGKIETDIKQANNHRIISVQLPDIVTADTSGSELYASTALALQYVFKRALQICQKAGQVIPLAINFSYGLGAGPHDGAAPIERSMRSQLGRYLLNLNAAVPTAQQDELDQAVKITLPIGNRRLTQAHAQANADDTGVAILDLNWILQPNDYSSNFMEIWLPQDANLDALTLTPPDNGMALNLYKGIANAPVVKEIRRNNNVIGRMVFSRYAPNNRWYVHIALSGTAAETANNFTPSGQWKLNVKASSITGNQDIHAWIQRDDSALGLPTRGRTSYFDDAVYAANRRDETGQIEIADQKPPITPIRREGTISSIATRPNAGIGPLEKHIHVVGGKIEHVVVSGDPDDALYSALPLSSAGFICFGTERSWVRRGIPATATLSGSWANLSGTSVAAPQKPR